MNPVVRDSRSITVEIDGAVHKLTLNEARELYRLLGQLDGVPYSWTWPTYPIPRYPSYPTYPIYGSAHTTIRSTDNTSTPPGEPLPRITVSQEAS